MGRGDADTEDPIVPAVGSYKLAATFVPLHSSSEKNVRAKLEPQAHQILLEQLRKEAGTELTRNPVALEATESDLRAYFIPEDNDSRLFIYEVSFR